MTTSWDTDIAAKWQQLMSAWEEARQEHELAKKDIEADTSDSAVSSARRQRFARSQARLDQLQADIDQLVAERGKVRDPSKQDFVVATLPQGDEKTQRDNSAMSGTSDVRKKG